ncbi:MAG: DUF484 family protein [Paracoccaceae bacterium]|jgi:uncharacterized protein YigA (DUF484 family)
MSGKSDLDTDLRKKILARPNVILDDKDLMRALVGAKEEAMGGNIVDIRGIAMERLEHRLDRLEDTHRSVIAAAYENLAGTNQIHRAILRMMDPLDFPSFLSNLDEDVREILRVEYVALFLETRKRDTRSFESVLGAHNIVKLVPAGFVDTYLTLGRNTPVRDVILREIPRQSDSIYESDLSRIKSEALMRLKFGAGRLPGMLVLGAEDPHQFSPHQGTDLLAFFAGVFERIMRRWLA